MDLNGAPARVAFFLATSGHSGVDRLMRNLVPAVARRGYVVDQLKVRRHGPDLGGVPGVRVVDLGAHHVWSSLPAVVGYLRRERPAVMLTDKDKVNRAALAARAMARVPTRLVLRSGTSISVDLQHRGPVDRFIQRTSMRMLYRFADCLVTPSQAARRDHVDYARLPEAFVLNIPNPVLPAHLFDTAPPRPDHRWFDTGAPPVVLGAGELSVRKDFATLLRAFARLRRQRDCRLVILGQGKEERALRSLAVELAIDHDVDFAGFRPNIFSWMAHSAVFALSSRWEGFGNVMAEALACGTPVVATDCPGGARELLQDGVLCPLVAVNDDAALALALERVLSRPKDVERMRAAARPYEIESATTAYLEAMGLPARAGAAS